MNRPWVVRSIALLLVLIGLQAGSFRDLDTGEQRYFGTADYHAAVAPEAGKPHVLPPTLLAAQLPHPPYRTHALPALPVRAAAQAVRLPDPTGPPRA